jgi:hypothetical protein
MNPRARRQAGTSLGHTYPSWLTKANVAHKVLKVRVGARESKAGRLRIDGLKCSS